jgi:hypothetical protein
MRLPSDRTEAVPMDGVREYCEGYAVRLSVEDGRLTVQASNEGGHNSTEVDLLDVIGWLRRFAPGLLTGDLP